MLFLDEDCMIACVNGIFAFGLHATSATGHETIRRLAETGDTAGTGYREIDVDDRLAGETIALGKKYRQEFDRKGILPMDTELRPQAEKHQLLSSSGKYIPGDFQAKALELYLSAGIRPESYSGAFWSFDME